MDDQTMGAEALFWGRDRRLSRHGSKWSGHFATLGRAGTPPSVETQGRSRVQTQVQGQFIAVDVSRRRRYPPSIRGGSGDAIPELEQYNLIFPKLHAF